MAEETIVYLSLIVRVIKDSPPEDTQNCSPPHKPSHRSSWVSLCDWAVDPFVPRPLCCTDYTYIFFFSVSMEVHIILFSLFFLSISFLSRLIVANSEYLYFRCTGFHIIFNCSLVNHISGITYVESTGKQLLVYEHALGKASFLVLFLKHILIKLKKFK